MISGQGAPRTDRRRLSLSADPPDSCGFMGSFCILRNCPVHYGNFALCVSGMHRALAGEEFCLLKELRLSVILQIIGTAETLPLPRQTSSAD